MCKNGDLWWLRPDGTTRVTIEHVQRDDGSVEPRNIQTVVISARHTESLKAARSKEVAEYSGPEETTPSMAEVTAAGAATVAAFSPVRITPTVEGCAAHICRRMAKSVVNDGLIKR